MIHGLINEISQAQDVKYFGTVSALKGLLFEVKGMEGYLATGNQCYVYPATDPAIIAEVVGFNHGVAQMMAYQPLNGVGPGCRVEKIKDRFTLCPDRSWLGRVVNGFGEPLDGGPRLPYGESEYFVYNSPLPAHQRQRVKDRIDMGVRAINTFTTCCYGQRMGIFAGSGVGKSVLMSQIAKFTTADINVIGLIGERGREVREFIEDTLDPETLARSIIVVATSDEPSLMRRQAAHLTLTIAEYFRDQNYNVLCFLDSVTRFAMALREIGLSVGEPPASKGYTPSVFAELPRLLERAGPGHKEKSGSITGIFTVLVEGDDDNEPISDAVRSILDGHVVLDRNIANRNRFPAVNVLKSISRMMPECNSPEETQTTSRAREMISAYDDMAEMIRLGAYRGGSDTKLDEAIELHESFENFLRQDKQECCSLEDGFQQLKNILNHEK
ncbi:MAG: flagellar protein export ATPase FliI [Alphaproteobacteria bacterium]|nr:flagellar protein export ATPase FliI [Alphaproteobacteria bacterium]